MSYRFLSIAILGVTLLGVEPFSYAKSKSKKMVEPKLAAPTVCINWPKVFEQESVRRLENRGTLVSVSLFGDDTGVTGDDWLQQGLANLLIRMLNTNPNVGALPERNTSYLPPEHRVQFKVGGIFQHTQNWLRIFVQLKDNNDKLLGQFTVETPYPLHKQFFTGLREAAAGILEKMGTKKGSDLNILKAIEDETDNVRAYENYTKGMQAYEAYDPNKIEVAQIWFQESRKEDSQYPQAFRGLMNVYNFLSLYHKANSTPYGQDLENGEATMNALAKQGRKTGPEVKNRFLSAQVHFVLGDRALSKGDAAKAVAELSQAAELVPEDPVTALYLSQAYEKLGNAKLAGQFKNHAEEINACLKGN